MGFWDRLFRNKNDQHTTPPTQQSAVVEPATREQIAVDPNSFFQVGMFKDAAKARYRRQNTKDMAIAAWKLQNCSTSILPTTTSVAWCQLRPLPPTATRMLCPFIFCFTTSGNAQGSPWKS